MARIEFDKDTEEWFYRSIGKRWMNQTYSTAAGVLKTDLRNGCRCAGSGTAEDNYSEESYGGSRVRMLSAQHLGCRLPQRNAKEFNSEVIIIKEGNK